MPESKQARAGADAGRERIERVVADVGRAMARRWWPMSPERALRLVVDALGREVFDHHLPADVVAMAFCRAAARLPIGQQAALGQVFGRQVQCLGGAEGIDRELRRRGIDPEELRGPRLRVVRGEGGQHG